MKPIRIGRTSIPVAAVMRAVRAAVKATRASAADNRDKASPGGAKVTPGEVAEDVAAFVAAFAVTLGDELLGVHSL